MVKYLLALLIGLLTGVVSGCGVGGGSLLMLYLTVVLHMDANRAAVINLLYFFGCALPALRAHSRNRLVKGDVALLCLPAGLTGAAAGAWIAMGLDTGLLRRGFGLFLLYIGYRELKSGFARSGSDK